MIKLKPLLGWVYKDYLYIKETTSTPAARSYTVVSLFSYSLSYRSLLLIDISVYLIRRTGYYAISISNLSKKTTLSDSIKLSRKVIRLRIFY